MGVQSGPVGPDTKVELPQDGSIQRQNAGFLAPGQTKLSMNCDSISTTTTVTIPLPLPPTGKALIITDMILTHSLATAQRFAITVGGITVWSTLVHGSAAPDIVSGIETQIDIPQGVQGNLVINGASTMVSYVNISMIQQAIGQG